MLAQERLVAFMATADAARARAFFEGVLGLTFVSDDEHLVIFETESARLMLQKTNAVAPPHGTALGWLVKDLRGTMQALTARGVAFERSKMTDEMGVWSPAPGTGVAWFFDPDGNRLSLTQSEA